MKGLSLHDREIVLVHGARTPFGTFCGVFTGVSATDLGVIAAKEAIRTSLWDFAGAVRGHGGAPGWLMRDLQYEAREDAVRRPLSYDRTSTRLALQKLQQHARLFQR